MLRTLRSIVFFGRTLSFSKCGMYLACCSLLQNITLNIRLIVCIFPQQITIWLSTKHWFCLTWQLCLHYLDKSMNIKKGKHTNAGLWWGRRYNIFYCICGETCLEVTAPLMNNNLQNHHKTAQKSIEQPAIRCTANILHIDNKVHSKTFSSNPYIHNTLQHNVLKGSVHLNHNKQYFLLYAWQYPAMQTVSVLCAKFWNICGQLNTMEVKGIYFVMLKESSTAACLSRENVPVSLSNPQT